MALLGLVRVLERFWFVGGFFLLTAQPFTEIAYALAQFAGHLADAAGAEQQQYNYQDNDQFRSANIAKHFSFFQDEFTTTE